MSVCGGEPAFCGSDGRDNGEAGAGGQPARRAFPKAFVGLTGLVESALAGPEESALQQRLDLLVKFLERSLALDHLAIDEKGWRRVDLQHVAGEFLVGGDLVEQRLVLEAGLDGLLAEARLPADSRQQFRGVLRHPV